MSESFSDTDSESDDSQSKSSVSFEAEEEEPEGVVVESVKRKAAEIESDEDYDYYKDEPEADEEWLKQYNSVIKTAEEKLNVCKQRLEKEIPVDLWCKCGNCSVEYLVNPTECQCCVDIDGCETALNSDLVVQEVGNAPKCITQHPGFPQVCLQKWSLRLSAGKYRDKEKKGYRVKGSEESFLRAVAYREFSQLVHGYLGNRRIPLPACAYHEIRKTFSSDKGTLIGYDDNDDDDDDDDKNE